MKTHLVVAGCCIHEGKVLLVLHKKLKIWLPPGGHIEADEVPDDALAREFKEEVGLDIEILNRNELPMEGNVRRQLAVPFHVNVHNVGDHDHCCLYYLCRPRGKQDIRVLKSELDGARWFSRKELEGSEVRADVRNIAKLALSLL